MFRLKLISLAICIALLGCDSGVPTEPASLFGTDIVEASLVKSSYAITEGQTALVQINFNRKTKARTYVNWEIRGGIGRFLKPTGVIPVAIDTNKIEIPLESFRNETIDAAADFEVLIYSDSFAAPLTVTISLTDLTVPANVQISPGVLLELPVTGINVQSSGSLTLNNVGQVPARSLSPSSFSDPQMYFLGGTFPGVGGTCTSVLPPGGNCTVVVGATLTNPGFLDLPLVFSYNNGVSTQTKSVNVRAAADSVIAVLSGVPAAQSKTKILNITVGGVGIDNYKYKIGSASSTDCTVAGGYSGAPITVGTLITQDISAIPDGQIKLCVIGYKMGTQQSFNAATSATWYKDTAPPDIIGPGIAINNGDLKSKVLPVQLKMTTNGSQFMYITNSPGCSAGGTWEVYTQNKSWNLSFANNLNRVYAKFRDSLGNETACINAAITHDDVAPQVTVNQDVLQSDPTLSLPVVFIVTFSEDIVAASFSSAAVEQTGSASGVAWLITPLSGSQYKLEAVAATSGGSIIPRIRAGLVVDLAGNLSEASTSTDASVSYSLIEFYFKSVSLGSEQSCAFANDGKLYCWGSNANYALGFGPEMTPPLGFVQPHLLDYSHLASVQFKKVDVGTISSCGISMDGKLYCWGKGDNYTSGQFNPSSLATKIDQTVPKEAMSYSYGYVLACSNYTMPENSYLYSDVSVGKNHVCAIEKNGHALCFGMVPERTSGTPEYATPKCILPAYQRPGGKNAEQISSGGFGSCVLASDGKVYCLGSNNYGQIGDATTTPRTQWTLVNTGGLTGFTGFKQLSAGDQHVCAVSNSGQVYCWGLGTSGQVGDGNFSSRSVPTPVNISGLGAVSFAEVKAGLNHTCARTTQGKVYCWGEAANGKLGNASVTNQATPGLVLATSGSFENIKSLDVGDRHACAIKGDGQMLCWGEQSTEGRLGNNATANANRPAVVQVGSYISKRSFSSISLGSDNTCAAGTDGKAYCWGAGVSGKLGNGSVDRAVPLATNTLSIPGEQFLHVATGVSHSCGLALSGKVYCWGQNNEGQLGNGSNVMSAVPVEVDTNIVGLNDPGTGDNEFLGFKSISVGFSHTCALYANGIAYCWGYGLFGQLGGGSTLSQSRPAAVSGSLTFKQIDTGDYHTCGIATNNKAYCWGWGALGRLGNGSTDNKLVPTQVDTSLNTEIAARPEELFNVIRPGTDHTCMSTIGKSIYCWGSGLDGRLGIDDSTEATKLYPATVDTALLADTSGIASLESGKDHSCLVTNYGKVACWGAGLKGRLGDGDFLDKAVPVIVDFSGTSGYLGSFQVSAGGSHTCALSILGEQYCWGEGLNGRLGNNSVNINQGRPVNILFP